MLLADAPTRVSDLNSKLVLLEWHPSVDARGVVALVPGWGAHPSYYGRLIRELTLRGFAVASGWPRSQPTALTSSLHYRHLSAVFGHIRREWDADVDAVAESLGAAHLLAHGGLMECDRAVLVSPGLILRTHQIASRSGLSDLIELLARGRVPLTGWRLESVSANPAFRQMVRSSTLTPPYSGTRYVLDAVRAALVGLVSPKLRCYCWIIQGGRDRLISPLGARLLAGRLGRDRCELTILPEARHGIFWDPDVGERVASGIAAYLARSR